MWRFRYAAGGGLPCLLLLVVGSSLRAEDLNPLRLVPRQAEYLLQVPHPKRLAETVTRLELLKELQAFHAFRELADSTNARRLNQLVTYVEKRLGLKWPELLDRLAGGGVALALSYGSDPAPGLLVLQGRDEELLRKFLPLALEVVDQELARTESKDRVERVAYRNLEAIRIGPRFFAAAAGSALLVSNNEAALHRGLNLYLDHDGDNLAGAPSMAEARKLLPPDPLAWSWLNLETFHKTPQAKELFELPRNDANLTVLFGGWLEVARHSPYLCAGVYAKPDGFLATLRMPRGRDSMAVALAAHLPPPGQPGSLPLLEPKGVLYSSSYYMDVSQFWVHRAKLLNPTQTAKLEEFDKNSAPFLVGHHFSELLTQAGTYQRIVITNHGPVPLLNQPTDRSFTLNIPAFAWVLDMRDPEAFSKSMNSILRGAGLLASTQFKLKLVEEKHGQHTIVGYRFAEDADLKSDPTNIRYNFSPCFVRVGNQFVLSSTLELAGQLVDLLDKEMKGEGSPAAAATQFYAVGGAEALQANEDQLLAQTILDQALPPQEARNQVRAFLEWVRHLGVLRLEAVYGEQDFHYDIRLVMKK